MYGYTCFRIALVTVSPPQVAKVDTYVSPPQVDIEGMRDAVDLLALPPPCRTTTCSLLRVALLTDIQSAGVMFCKASAIDSRYKLSMSAARAYAHLSTYLVEKNAERKREREREREFIRKQCP